jgi:cell division protein FtsW (lipid II flippase)
MSPSSIEFGYGPSRVLRRFRFDSIVVDYVLLLTLLAIIGIGAIVLYSAAEQSTDLMLRQGVRIVAGLTVFSCWHKCLRSTFESGHLGFFSLSSAYCCWSC